MARIKSIRKIYSDGRHNAFTDLEYWKGHYYAIFRNSGRHAMPGDYGDVLVIRSPDLESWDLCARLSAGSDHDDRDPALLDMGDELGAFFGSSSSREQGGLLYEDKNRDRTNRCIQSYASFTSDGTFWSSPLPVFEPDMWLWQVEGFDGVYYGTARNLALKFKLTRSVDGRSWETVSEIYHKSKIGEAGLWITDDKVMHIVGRAKDHHDMALLARSAPPYTEWKVKELSCSIHSPVIRPVGDELWVAGRASGEQLPHSLLPPAPDSDKIEALARRDERIANPQDWFTALWRLTENDVEPILVLPSRGDNAYPGMVAEKDRVLISYYSQHDADKSPEPRPGEKVSDIFIAELEV